MSQAEDRIVIAGAGPAGLVAAAILAEAGVAVIVLEAEGSFPSTSGPALFIRRPSTCSMTWASPRP